MRFRRSLNLQPSILYASGPFPSRSFKVRFPINFTCSMIASTVPSTTTHASQPREFEELQLHLSRNKVGRLSVLNLPKKILL